MEKKDVYERVTARILEDLEKGVRPWMRPWNAEHAAGCISRPLRHNGMPYAGVNVIMLWSEASEKEYTAPIWMTFRQAKALHGQVRKGEHGSFVVYANTVTKKEQDEETGDEVERKIPIMKGYTVFNVEQIDGLPDRYYRTEEEPSIEESERDKLLDAFFASTGAEIRHGGNKAYYRVGSDYIQMPPFPFFRDKESYYATLAHESAHWTRHPARLNRSFGRKRFGDEGYAMEELVAELSSAFLAADLGFVPEVREEHAAYIASWIGVLRNDKRAIFTAAAHAQRAVAFLQAFQAAADPAPGPEGGEFRPALPVAPTNEFPSP
ncbi:MAG: ssDNA-binding domain-containing protein [Candidatus Hydrogenedentes bacterium]|nr:ssDNA-binding domain-containing protein [Candidatus Hydrogenedentota bacterium]